MTPDEQTKALAKRRRKRRTIRRLKLAALVLVLLAAAAAIVIPLLRRDPSEAESTVTAAGTETLRPAPLEPPLTASTEPTQPLPPATEAPQTQPPETEAPIVEVEGDWKLILVNADHPIPEDYSFTPKQLRNGHVVDERIYPQLQKMFDDARAAGLYPFINESTRTAQRQQQILDDYVAQYEAQGQTPEQALESALQVVAKPGTSEHQLGLALDIIAEFEPDSSETWYWLAQNSWRYGFILRYPAGKEALTGISYEPWHFRYVGEKAAKEITEGGLCLEEYLEQQP